MYVHTNFIMTIGAETSEDLSNALSLFGNSLSESIFSEWAEEAIDEELEVMDDLEFETFSSQDDIIGLCQCVTGEIGGVAIKLRWVDVDELLDCPGGELIAYSGEINVKYVEVIYPEWDESEIPDVLQ